MRTDMKVKVKLFIGFGIIIFTSTVVALTGFYAITSLNSNIVNLLDTRIPQMKTVADITEAISATSLRMDAAMRADSPEAVRAELGYTAGYQKATTDNMEKLKASLVSEKERALFQALSNQRGPYTTTRNKVV